MPRPFKQLPTLGVFIAFSQLPCQLVPAVHRQESHVSTHCEPGVPYEVMLEFIQPVYFDKDGNKVPEVLWLGLRPKQAQQLELDWVRASDPSGEFWGLYCRLNPQYVDDTEET